MGFKNLANIHPLRYTEWIKNDVDGFTILVKRHILNRLDDRDHTLVTVTSSHFVSRLDSAFHRKVNLYDFEDAGR